MRTDREQSDENREEAGLEEALKLWMEIRQVDRKKKPCSNNITVVW